LHAGGAGCYPTPAPSATSTPPPTETPTPPPTFTPLPSLTPTATPEEGKRSQRAVHFSMEDPKLLPAYFYRSFLQRPEGLGWGPDGMMYIADPAGRHIVRLALDGTIEETQTWSYEHMWNQNGPVDVAFAPDGMQYFTNRDHLDRVGEQGLAELINLTQVSYDIGQIAFSPSGELYYTKLEENGKLYRLDDQDIPHMLSDDIRYAFDLVFASSSVLYISKNWQGEVLRMNLSDGTKEVFIDGAGWGRVYLALDADSDLWVRSDDRLIQLSAQGEIKPFVLDGVTYGAEQPQDGYAWGPSAGIEFDDQGGLWVASLSSKVVRLAPAEPDSADPEYSLSVVYAGFDPSDAVVAPDGSVIAYNSNTQELWRIQDLQRVEEDAAIEQVQVLAKLDAPGPAALAIDAAGTIFIGSPDGAVLRVANDGALVSFATLYVEHLAAAADGLLYALAWRNDGSRYLASIDANGKVTPLLDKVEGNSLSDGVVLLAAKPEGGVYLYLGEVQQIYLVAADGSAALIRDYKFLGGLGNVVMTAAAGGSYFFVSDERGKLYAGYDDPGKETTTLARGFGPSQLRAVGLSPDGKFAYIIESGAIDKVPLQ